MTEIPSSGHQSNSDDACFGVGGALYRLITVVMAQLLGLAERLGRLSVSYRIGSPLPRIRSKVSGRFSHLDSAFFIRSQMRQYTKRRELRKVHARSQPRVLLQTSAHAPRSFVLAPPMPLVLPSRSCLVSAP